MRCVDGWIVLSERAVASQFRPASVRCGECFEFFSADRFFFK